MSSKKYKNKKINQVNMNIKNKIVKYGTKKADQFTANPLNYRTHPQKQREAVKQSLAELGWIGVAVENIQTGNLLDGHERVMQALENNEDVPYIQVDLTPDEEKLALAIFDKITGMATIDDEILEQLKNEIITDNEILLDVINDKEFTSSVSEHYDDRYEKSFEVVCECSDEADQRVVFDLLTKRGYQCRVLTL